MVIGFSKLTREQKRDFIASLFDDRKGVAVQLDCFLHSDKFLQKQFEEFSENTISNYFLPYGIAPNFVINDGIFHLPMVVEESSVVAAASNSAKFWASRGGFHAHVLGVTKLGHVHFLWNGDPDILFNAFDEIKDQLLFDVKPLTVNMEKRGGGILKVELVDMTQEIEHYYQLKISFDTCDSMGANFINSCLESFGSTLVRIGKTLNPAPGSLQIIMSILSNYTPECRVKVWVECLIEDLDGLGEGMSGLEFAKKFELAVKISQIDPFRAVTHNKGIYNGIDAVVIATGNDFRAIEACGHAWAARNGRYSGLTTVDISNGKFCYSLEVPMSIGTVGGLTGLHPLARFSLELLGKPSAAKLMEIAAVAGLANNFGAIRSLITKGIQSGHMKMHLQNILNFMGASDEEKARAKVWFKDKTVSYKAVEDYLGEM